MLSVIYAQCHFDEYHYAECQYSQCSGAFLTHKWNIEQKIIYNGHKKSISDKEKMVLVMTPVANVLKLFTAASYAFS
jgi:hypothetical protein